MKENSKVRKIAFVGDHLPRKCSVPRLHLTSCRPSPTRIPKASVSQCRSTTLKAVTNTRK